MWEVITDWQLRAVSLLVFRVCTVTVLEVCSGESQSCRCGQTWVFPRSSGSCGNASRPVFPNTLCSWRCQMLLHPLTLAERCVYAVSSRTIGQWHTLFHKPRELPELREPLWDLDGHSHPHPFQHCHAFLTSPISLVNPDPFLNIYMIVIPIYVMYTRDKVFWIHSLLFSSNICLCPQTLFMSQYPMSFLRSGREARR